MGLRQGGSAVGREGGGAESLVCCSGFGRDSGASAMLWRGRCVWLGAHVMFSWMVCQRIAVVRRWRRAYIVHGAHTLEVVSRLLPRLHAQQHVVLGSSKGWELRALQLQQILGVGFWHEG